MKNNKRLLVILITLLQITSSKAQDTLHRVIGIQEILTMTEENYRALKVSRLAVDLAGQRVEVAKLQRLPGASATVMGGYLGNATILDPDFSNAKTIPMPHFSNTFALQASQVIFKGNAINNAIGITSLQEQLSVIGFQENLMGAKLLVIGNYLDIFKLYNQRQVYEKNLSLALLRLKQITVLYHQGMVTKNDVIRTELQIANIRMAITILNNNYNIINKQLTTITGLNENMVILPDTSILERKPVLNNYTVYRDQAQNNAPAIRAAQTGVTIAQHSVAMAKADRLPTLSAYAGNNLARPITTALPPLDKYTNGWQAGLSLSFNIASIYTAPKTVRLNKIQLKQAEENEKLTRDNRNIAVNAAFIKHQEAISLSETLTENVRLAGENYRITEKKYLNQLALLIDVLDATNAKLDAELQLINSKINILYTYYQLQKEVGTL
ncbi:TolC family protein [Pedobacter sp. KLB.chiD]|uniref:TolC family protein n=1 Tax=Pedobacter sp. KLB.chiD TaxID=3387402 RepID=UPI00399BFA52